MKAVIYGAGNIGRGFIAQLFCESGYDIVFIDIDKALIDEINTKKEYPVKFAAFDKDDISDAPEIVIKNISGIDGKNINEVVNAIAEADIMATSVGVNVLNYIMETLALGINTRFKSKNYEPLNIILCENLINAEKHMVNGVSPYIDREYRELFAEKIGFVGAAIGRTVPMQTAEMKDDNPLRIVTEDYDYLPVDKEALKGDVPNIKNLVAYSPFKYFIERKLLLHNMGHAFCAYTGDIFGYDNLYEVLENPHIEIMTLRAMQRSALALSKIYGADILELNKYTENLLNRFSNKALGDTVKRVGKDLKRKLSPNDRIIGAYNICMKAKVSVNYFCFLIAAAVNYKGDELSGKSLEEILNAAGSYDDVKENIELIKKYDRIIKAGTTPEELNRILKIDESVENITI